MVNHPIRSELPIDRVAENNQHFSDEDFRGELLTREEEVKLLTGSKRWMSSRGHRRRCSGRRCPATAAPARSSRSPARRQTRRRAEPPTRAGGAPPFAHPSGAGTQMRLALGSR